MSDRVRVVFEMGRSFVAELEPEEAERVTQEGIDVIEISEVYERLMRIAHGHISAAVVDAWLKADPDDCSHLALLEPDPIDGTAPEGWYWTARHHVMKARGVLSTGRYREGDCPEMDAVNAELARIEDRLRLLAMCVDEDRKVAAS